MRTPFLLFATFCLVLGHPALADDADPSAENAVPTIIEECLLAPTGRMATVWYAPSETEKPFYAMAGFPNEDVSPQPATLSVKEGDYVSWFGIVRDVFDDEQWPKGRIQMLQVLYFEGLTDEHLQTVSINGPGDAFVEVRGMGEAVIPLMLVRVCGRVVRIAKSGAPIIEADYIRYWPWGMFNFRDRGEDHSAPIWREGTKIGSVRIYTGVFIDMDYYIDRIGGTAEQIEAQFKWFDENRVRVKAFVDSHARRDDSPEAE